MDGWGAGLRGGDPRAWQGVPVECARRLVFEPRGWEVHYRDELRPALSGLDTGVPTALVATYQTPDDELSDVENVLLYNLE